MEKLSELSKPVGFAREEDIKLMQSGKLLSGLTIWRSGKEPLYSQEYVSALLAELEAKDKAHRVHAARLISERGVWRERVTELEAIAADYADKFQKAQDAAKHLIIMNDKDKKRITELDRSETQLIDERDSAHAALDDMYEAITGKRPEWSNWFGFADAIEEVALIAAGFTVEGDE